MIDINNLRIDGEPDRFSIIDEYGDEVIDCDYTDSNAYPFIIDENGSLKVGRYGGSHGNITSGYEGLVNGRIWVDCDIFGGHYSIMSFWDNDESVDIDPDELDKLFNIFDISSEDVLVFDMNDGGIKWFNDWNYRLGIADSRQNDLHAIHLMNSRDKLDATKNFRDNRDKFIGGKLVDSNGREMTVAQYRSMLYGESLLNRIIIESINSYLERNIIKG